MNKKLLQLIKGFTLIELVITIAIFAAMTTYLLAKYGKFDQSLLLTNLAYDVALTIRTAQSYGLNVKAVGPNNAVNPFFEYAYGVHFNKGSSTKNCFVLFVDTTEDSIYWQSDGYCPGGTSPVERISSYSIKRGSIIQELLVCVGEGGTGEVKCAIPETLDISFKRPDPNARIFADGVNTIDGLKLNYAEITLLATDGITSKKIIVRSTGQIAIANAGIENPDIVPLD